MNILEIFDISFFLTILQMIPMLVMVWIGVVAAWGLLKKPKKGPEPQGNPLHFGIIVCAHNEQDALPSLLESIASQHYDRDKIRVFLLADHCTDQTVEVASRFPFVIVFERNEGPTTGKGAVLQWGLPRIFATDPENQIGAYAIIDSDNVLREDFIERMDVKLRQGNVIVQGNRLGGQPYRSVITKWYTIYWACYTVFFSYVREKCGLSAFLTGTGFAVNADLLRKEGWHTTSITEDVDYTIQNVLKGRRAAFCVQAICYDEQPYRFGTMFHQIERWCTGGYQVLHKYFTRLIRRQSGVQLRQRFDVIMMLLMGPCSWISTIISWVNKAVMLWNLPLSFFIPFAFASLFGTICVYIGSLAVLKYNHISRRKIGIWAVVTFPIFLWVYMFCSIKTCFFPTRKWAKVEHSALDTAQS